MCVGFVPNHGQHDQAGGGRVLLSVLPEIAQYFLKFFPAGRFQRNATSSSEILVEIFCHYLV
jgi:hypothetical protein